MQKKLLGVLALTALLALPHTVSAETRINISNNSTNSRSTVKVDDNSNDQKDIVIEHNGEKREYHGTDPSVHLELGTNSVSINGNKPQPTSNPTTKPTTSPTTQPSASASSTPSPSPTPDNTITIDGDVLGEATEKEKESVVNYLKRVLNSIWDKLF